MPLSILLQNILALVFVGLFLDFELLQDVIRKRWLQKIADSPYEILQRTRWKLQKTKAKQRILIPTSNYVVNSVDFGGKEWAILRL